MKSFKQQWQLYAMLIPAIVLVILFAYIPMYGVVIAFQKFSPAKGLFGAQKWVGLDNFTYLFSLPNTIPVIRNTVVIALGKMVGMIVIPVITAILINELKSDRPRRIVQTMVSFPHFVSWILMAGILSNILAGDGLVNNALTAVGIGKIGFLTDAGIFPWTIIVSEIWKEFGFGCIIYLATLTNIDPTLYEAASIDGAGHFKCIWHITLPGLANIIALMALLSLGNILSAGFDQIYNLYNDMVMSTGDVIDTYVYRVGMLNFKYGPASAMGLFKSIISAAMISMSYYLAYKLADYRVF